MDEIRGLTLADAPVCVQLTASVGWGHTQADWEKRIIWGGPGSLGMFVDERLVASTIAIAFDEDMAWIAMVITHPDYQRRGYARQLMEVALDFLDGTACIMLDASVYGAPLYADMGFRACGTIDIYEGTAPAVDIAPTPEPLEDVMWLAPRDAALFGTYRPQILADLFGQAWRVGEGYVLLHGREGAYNIGPWYHPDPQQAEALLQTALHHAAGSRVVMHIPGTNHTASALVTRHGLELNRTNTRMIYQNGPIPPRMMEQFSIASPTLG